MRRSLQFARSMPLLPQFQFERTRNPAARPRVTWLLALSLALLLAPGPAWMHWLVALSGHRCLAHSHGPSGLHLPSDVHSGNVHHGELAHLSCSGQHLHEHAHQNSQADVASNECGTQSPALSSLREISGSPDSVTVDVARIACQPEGLARDCSVCRHFAKQLYAGAVTSSTVSQPLLVEVTCSSLRRGAPLRLVYSPRGPPACC